MFRYVYKANEGFGATEPFIYKHYTLDAVESGQARSEYYDLVDRNKYKLVSRDRLVEDKTDKKGDDIYENDIVSLEWGRGTYVGIIKFGKFEVDSSGGEYGTVDCLGWYMEGVPYWNRPYSWSQGEYWEYSVTIVGNIHANPELLEENHGEES